MIDTLIFDFGDVFLNLDKKGAKENALTKFGIADFSLEMNSMHDLYETGRLSTAQLLSFYASKYPHLDEDELVSIWNYILLDFPHERLEFLHHLRSQYSFRRILLSNTNEMHIDYLKKNLKIYDQFKSMFHRFYLSHEIQLRKPNRSIFQFVLDQNNLRPEDCLFIDDTSAHIQTASEMGFYTWHLDPDSEDVTQLFEKHGHLFNK